MPGLAFESTKPPQTETAETRAEHQPKAADTRAQVIDVAAVRARLDRVRLNRAAYDSLRTQYTQATETYNKLAADPMKRSEAAALYATLQPLYLKMMDAYQGRHDSTEPTATVYSFPSGEVITPEPTRESLHEDKAVAEALAEDEMTAARRAEAPGAVMSMAEVQARQEKARAPVAEAEERIKQFEMKEDVKLVKDRVGDIVSGWMRSKGAEELSVLMTPDNVRSALRMQGGGELPKYISNEVVQLALDDLKKRQQRPPAAEQLAA